jgi:hypothetical protein
MPGLRKPGEYETVYVEEELDDEGYVLSIETGLTTVDGNVMKATSTYYQVYGVNIMSTEDPTNPDGANLTEGYIAIARDGIRDVQITAATNRTTDIVAGDVLAVYDAGAVAHMTDCPIATLLGTVNAANLQVMLKAIVGVATEAVAATADPADGKIECRLTIR